MMRFRFAGFVLAALAACLPVAVASSEPEEPLRGHFHGEATISDAGIPAIDRVEGVSGALERVVRAKLAEARWVPGIREGKPVAATVPFTGHVLLQAVEGGDYAVQDLQVRVAPAVVEGPTPMWRPPFLREGVTAHVELRLQIDGRGNVTMVEPVSSSSPSFEREARKTLLKWRFTPLPEGLATMMVTLPVWFHVGGASPAKPDFACERDPSLPALADQDGCLDLVEIVAVRRGSVTL